MIIDQLKSLLVYKLKILHKRISLFIKIK
jgi:hypothetical protein